MSQLLADHLLLDNGVSIPFEERATGLQERVVENQIHQTRVFLVAWEDRWLFANGCLGTVAIEGNELVRTLPVYSEIGNELIDGFEASSELYALELQSIQGIAARTGKYPLVDFAYAEVTIDFGKPTYNIASSISTDVVQSGNTTSLIRYISRQGTRIYFEYPVHRGLLTYADTGGYAVNSIEKKDGQILLSYTWHQVPSRTLGECSQLENILPFIGTVNADTFDGWPPESLLLTNVSTTDYWLPSGVFCSDISFYMKHLDRSFSYGGLETPPTAWGHNHFYKLHGGDSGVYRFSTNGESTGYPVYSPVLFADLFLV